MTEKVGGIEYYVDADVSAVQSAEAVVDKSTKAMESDFLKVESATNKAANSQSKFSDQTKKADKATGAFGRKAGMASIQIQQFTGQVQGGVNPMIAMSQQAADLGIVLGAPLLGSIVGIGAALAINFMPNVFKSKTALEELKETSEKIKETMELSANGVALYSDSLRKLAQRSESLAKVKIAIAMSDASKQIKTASTEINESIKDLSQGTFKNFNDAIAESGKTLEDFASAPIKLSTKFGELTTKAVAPLDSAVKGLGRKFDINRKQATDLAQALSFFANNKNALGAKALEDSLAGLNKEFSFGNEKLLKFTDKLLPFFESLKSNTDVSNELKMALTDLNGALEEAADADSFDVVNQMQKTLQQSLEVNRAKIKDGEHAARRLALAFELGKDSAAQLPEGIKETITQIEALEAKEKASAEKEKNRLKEKAKAESEIRKKAREEEMANKKIIADFDKLNQNLKFGGMSEIDRIQADFDSKRALILEHEALLLSDKTLSDAQRVALEDQTNSALLDIERDAAAKRARIAEIEKQGKMNAVSSTFSALSSLMNTESKKLFEIGKAASIAGAIVDGYAAVSKTMASVPYPFNVPLAAAQAVASAVQVQNIAKQKVGGAKTMNAASSFSGGQPAVNTQSSGGNRNISIAGIDASSLITGGQLIDALNEALGDGYSVNFGGG